MRPEHAIMNADVTASTMESGDVRVNIGDSLTNEGVAAEAPWWCNGDGFVSRPNDPDGDGACETVYAHHGNQRVCIAARDARYSEKAGELQPGDRAIVSRGEARFLLKAETDSVTLYTADQTNNDASMMVNLDGSRGSIKIMVGGTYIELKDKSIVLSTGGAMLSLDATAIQAFASHVAMNAKTGNLGVVGVAPPPPGVNSLLAGVSGMTGIPSPGWTVTTTP
jgi:hypothetical protein